MLLLIKNVNFSFGSFPKTSYAGGLLLKVTDPHNASYQHQSSAKVAADLSGPKNVNQ